MSMDLYVEYLKFYGIFWETLQIFDPALNFLYLSLPWSLFLLLFVVNDDSIHVWCFINDLGTAFSDWSIVELWVTILPPSTAQILSLLWYPEIVFRVSDGSIYNWCKHLNLIFWWFRIHSMFFVSILLISSIKD